MSDWKECLLGNFITLKRGYDLPERERIAGNVPVVSSAGVSGYHNIAKVKAPGVVTGRYGTLGEVFYLLEDFWPHNTALYVQDFKGNNPRFISYFLTSIGLAFRNAAGAVPGVNRNHLHQIVVRVPSVKIQEKIAAILAAYDDLIENNLHRIKLLEQAARDLYQEWFVHFRYPGHEQVETVSSELGQIPMNWRVIVLGDVCSYINRGIAPKYDETAENIVINQRCIRDGRLNLNIARRNARTVPSEKLVQLGDILVNSTGEGTLGRVAQVYEDISNCTVDSHVSIVRPIEPKFRDYMALHMLDRQSELARMGEGATNQTELTRSRLGALKLVLPTDELAERFSFLVSPIRRESTILQKKNDVLASMRDLLLPRLISGELDVSQISAGGIE